jgi:ceramide glucosyltransferase
MGRRIRWLRVRKFTVRLATFVELGTESASALTTLLFIQRIGIPATWSAFALIWLVNMTLWCTVDYIQYLLLYLAKPVEIDADMPDFDPSRVERNYSCVRAVRICFTFYQAD